VSPFPSALEGAQQYALDWLRQLINARALRPGDRIDEEDLADRMRVSAGSVREALRMLAQEGQVAYRSRRGYFVADLRMEDVREIYELRRILEERAARAALPTLDDEALSRIRHAAADFVNAVESDDVVSALAANRRFHFAMMDDVPTRPHTLELILVLWDSSEVYRAVYYNSRDDRLTAIDAHDQILDALARRDADSLVAEMDTHRQRALDALASILETGA
jgi:DNA-binding GntR family transcriptional regulator